MAARKRNQNAFLLLRGRPPSELSEAIASFLLKGEKRTKSA
jgi:hypothetical protein